MFHAPSATEILRKPAVFAKFSGDSTRIYVPLLKTFSILSTKDVFSDIYGHKPGYEANKLSREVLERKAEYCDHLLSLAARLSPGESEMKG
jgi:hypothetical protein